MSGEACLPGPLSGVRVLELEASGPVPFCAMFLADMGARVLRIERPAGWDAAPNALGLSPRDDVLLRNRRRLALDLKTEGGRRIARRLAQRSDVLLEGFRPGTAERLGIGPGDLLPLNPRLIYARVTGWGQDGPMATRAGHDINFLAATGALAALGRPGEPPAPPLNMVADFGGGGMLAAFGVAAALYETRASGRGQVLDVAMVDGVTSLLSSLMSFRAAGAWERERGTNLLDGGAPWYDCYATADGRYLALGCVEPRFFAGMLDFLGLDEAFAHSQFDRAAWPRLRDAIARRVAEHDQAAWAGRLAEVDLCITPVLDLAEAVEHPGLRARGTHAVVGGRLQPGPAPRFSRTPGCIRSGAGVDDEEGMDDVLAWWGVPLQD